MKFKKIYIEITNVCNLNCSFCAKNKRPASFMSEAQFHYLLKQIKPYTNYLYFHVLGEPLLHPQLEQFLNMAQEAGFFVNLTSNGILLPQRVNILKGRIRQLNLSLHSLPQEAGCHPDRYLQDCLRCGDELAEAGCYLSYRFWNKKAGKLDEESARMLEVIATHYGIDDLMYENQKLASRRFLNFEEQFVWPSLQHPYLSQSGTCYGMRQQCAILVDGTLVPCCLDSLGECSLGNVFEQPFATLIASARAQTMIEGFQKGKLCEALCQRCGFRKKFD